MRYVTDRVTTYGAVSIPKIVRGHCPHQPLITESIFSVLRNQKEPHIGLHLKSVISRVANSVMGETRKNGRRAGAGFLGVPSPSARELGGAL